MLHNTYTHDTCTKITCTRFNIYTLAHKVYSAAFIVQRQDGAGDEIRTRDLQLGRLSLYQLSYSRMVGAAGFEPTTLCSQSRCATRLRYAPIDADIAGCRTSLQRLIVPKNLAPVKTLCDYSTLVTTIWQQVKAIRSEPARATLALLRSRVSLATAQVRTKQNHVQD